MKKSLLLLIIIASLLMASTALAFPEELGILKIDILVTKYKTLYTFRMPLVQKDPTDWSVVEDGAWGLLEGKSNKYLTFRASGLKPSTSYTLIYYGDETHNDVWPYATCIRQMTTSGGKVGFIGLTTTKYDYSLFMDDGIDQKFWLILSNDVDCDAGVMTGWHPSEYLFEWDVL